MGRAVIAMTAVRRGACVSRGKIADHPDVRPPTDVMVITSLPGCAVTQRENGSRIGCGGSTSGRDGSPNRPFVGGDSKLDRDNGGLGEPALPKGSPS